MKSDTHTVRTIYSPGVPLRLSCPHAMIISILEINQPQCKQCPSGVYATPHDYSGENGRHMESDDLGSNSRSTTGTHQQVSLPPRACVTASVKPGQQYIPYRVSCQQECTEVPRQMLNKCQFCPLPFSKEGNLHMQHGIQSVIQKQIRCYDGKEGKDSFRPTELGKASKQNPSELVLACTMVSGVKNSKS